MSTKLQLPDELLDMISGGAVTMGGVGVQSIYAQDDEVHMTTADGTSYVYSNPDTGKAFKMTNPEDMASAFMSWVDSGHDGFLPDDQWQPVNRV